VTRGLVDRDLFLGQSPRASAREHLPELERFRLDADVSSRPGAVRDVLERFRTAERAVLVGTQMVAKGHHVPGVALAAVVDADTGLSLPDFRAEERTFQLVTQLAGRSGRDAPGRVVVQTFQPDATPLRHAVNHDVAGFLAGELERREVLGYPPFRHLVSILVSGPEPGAPLAALRELVLREVAEDVGARRHAHPLEPLAQQAVSERILALIEPQPKSQRILRRAWRSAQRLGSEIDALWVRPSGREPTREETTQLAALRRVAGVLGVHFLEEDGDDLVETVRRVAQERGSTYIFVGTPDERRRTEILRGSLLSRMVREIPGIDIRVVADRAMREAESR